MKDKGSLARYSPWACKESDTPEPLSNNTRNKSGMEFEAAKYPLKSAGRSVTVIKPFALLKSADFAPRARSDLRTCFC